jgi:2-keto-4-pentenoate hydratase/2-oxohepta-3-ene-1,7-dioic acid hydratase in catechol pathway
MKLATFVHDRTERAGLLDGDEIVDLSAATSGGMSSVIDVIQAGERGRDQVQQALSSNRHRLALSEVTLRPPVTPSKFLAIGLNYADHVAESGLETPKHLTVFYKAPTSVTGPYDPIERPAVSLALDYEGELGVVIGRRCKHVTAADAADVIAGYVIVNDVSVRDWQLMTTQWSLGKSFDTHGPFGPYLVTADEVEDPHSLDLRTLVNDEVRQSSNTRHLIFNCFDSVEILSQAMTLEPGDVIATGTPSGIAGAMPGQPWLVPGDRVRVEIDGLGAIENSIVEEPVPTGFTVNPDWVGDPLAARS